MLTISNARPESKPIRDSGITVATVAALMMWALLMIALAAAGSACGQSFVVMPGAALY